MAIIKHLQQNVEDIRVRFFDLVKQDHTVRVAAHFFGELAAFLVADVSRRGSDQFGDAVFLHVLRHIDADHCLLLSKDSFCQCLGYLCLADACRSQEKERSDRALGLF